MENIYDKKPLKVVVINPFNSNVLLRLQLPSKIEGGNIKYKEKLQNMDLSVFDKNIDDLNNTEDMNSKILEGDPSNITPYPFDNIIELRKKIFIATGIHPYRQYILLSRNDGIISLTYTIFVGQDIVDTNIFNNLQNLSEDTFLNLSLDKTLINNKNSISIEMRDVNTILYTNCNNYISKVIVCDLFNIINPYDKKIVDIMNSSLYQREMLYYGFILKFFPLLTYPLFEALYVRNINISSLSTFLDPNFFSLKLNLNKEEDIINKLVDKSEDMLKYYKKYKSDLEYSISKVVMNIKINELNIRSLFDLFILDDFFIWMGLRIVINGKEYLVDKKYSLYKENINIFSSKVENNTILLMTSTGIEISIHESFLFIKVSFFEEDMKTFEDVNKDIKKILILIIDKINKLDSIAIKQGSKIDIESINVNILSSEIITYWPETFTTEQFNSFKNTLELYEKINLVTILVAQVGNYIIKLNKSSGIVNKEKQLNLLSQFPNIINQYEYYSNEEFRNKWNLLTKKTINILQKASNTKIIFTGFNDSDFEDIFILIFTFIYLTSKASKTYNKIEKISKDTKFLAKLKGTDPALYNIKRYDSSYQVYAIKCQSERQPLIYKKYELDTLSDKIKNNLIEFWNFTEEKPVYYYCPNKEYPHLSFRPSEHPLGYCLPCCKKLVPSEGSRQSKIDKLCYEKKILPHNEIDEIIKNLEREATHLLSYGKEINIGRFSKIPSIIENILSSKDLYRLIGVEQNLKVYEYGGFIFSIIYCLKKSLEDFVKDITKIMNNNILHILDQGHTQAFVNVDELKNFFTNMILGSNIISDISDNIDWINVLLQLVYLTYGIHIIIFIDEGTLNIKTINTTKQSLINKESDEKYIIIVSHNNGIYPLVQIRGSKDYTISKYHFGSDDNIIVSLQNILFKVFINKDKFKGLELTDIFLFIKQNNNYKVLKMYRGKRGLVYAVILKKGNNQIYIPCIYSDFLNDKDYTIIDDDFPSPDDFDKYYKRSYLYDFINNYNAFVIKKRKFKEMKILRPASVMKYKDKYIGLQIKFVNNNFAFPFYHSSEKTIGNYDVKIIDVPYSLSSIVKSISKTSSHIVHPDIKKFGYNNYIYSLFIIEFSALMRTYKNEKIRNQLSTVLNSKKQIDRRIIKDILKDHILDYNTIIKLLSIHMQYKVDSIVKSMLFNFDMTKMMKLKELKYDERIANIEDLMKSRVIFSNEIPDVSNIMSSCQTDYDFPQCKDNKLIISKEKFKRCCELLSKDIEVPYLYETIMLRTFDTKNELNFIRRKTEILHISEINND